MKRKISCIVGIVTLFMLTGCGVRQAKSDKEILQELDTGTIQYESQELTIQEMEITDRRTDTSGKKDTVYVSVIAENDVVSCEMSYVAEYSLYDQGWVLDSFRANDRSSWIIKPVSAPEKELLEENSYGSYVDIEVLPDEGTAFYYYERTADESYCFTRSIYKARYEFNTEEMEWEYISTETVERESEWDVDGTWSYVSTPGVTIMGGSALESTNHHMTLSIEVDNDVAHVVAYTQGDNIVYFDGDITLAPGEGGCSESVEFSYEAPGFMPIIFRGEIYITPESVFISNASQFERISTDKLYSDGYGNEKDSNSSIVTIAYDANGGYGAPEEQSVVIVDGVANYTLSEQLPSRDGYSFAGWRLENSSAYAIDIPGQSITIAVPEGCTLTYYAQWN